MTILEACEIIMGGLIAWALLIWLFVWGLSRFTRHVRGLHNMPSWERGDIKDLKD